MDGNCTPFDSTSSSTFDHRLAFERQSSVSDVGPTTLRSYRKTQDSLFPVEVERLHGARVYDLDPKKVTGTGPHGRRSTHTWSPSGRDGETFVSSFVCRDQIGIVNEWFFVSRSLPYLDRVPVSRPLSILFRRIQGLTPRVTERQEQVVRR